MDREHPVVDYLRRRSFLQLEEEHGVCARPSADGTKFSLNYDQILAKSGNTIAEHCRGLVIRPLQWNWAIFKDDWKNATVGEVEVVAWPMNRFYNFGDAACAPVDWADRNLRVYEKVDGTCIICYWDRLAGRWHCATRSVPEADLPINVGNLEIGDATFSDLFLRGLIETREETSDQKVDWVVDGIDKVIHLNKELTYVFELVSPWNQVVVSYPKPRVYLLAARHTMTGREIPIEDIRLQHVLRPKVWNIKDVAALACFVDAADPAQLEGAVVCDSQFRRMKVKNKSYVLAHKSKDTVMSSARNALECVILEKVDDIAPLVPTTVQDMLFKMQAAYAKFCADIDSCYVQYALEAGGSRKDFALKVQASGHWQAPFFNMWQKRAGSTREWVKGMADAGKLPTSSLDAILDKLAL
jgi:hypothetical protein